jgi:hypothetical protein
LSDKKAVFPVAGGRFFIERSMSVILRQNRPNTEYHDLIKIQEVSKAMDLPVGVILKNRKSTEENCRGKLKPVKFIFFEV